MKSFYLRLALFVLPLVAVAGGVAVVLRQTGEMVPLGEIIARQRQAPVLYGTAYVGSVPAYKLESVKQRRPEIIAMGSSQAFQLRQEFFRDPSRFYNASMGALPLSGPLLFLEQLPPEALPKVILLTVDSWWFNPKDRDNPGGDGYFATPQWSSVVRSSWKAVLGDLRAGKIVFHPQASQRFGEAIGIAAANTGWGFRSDGSFRYGTTTESGKNSDGPGFRDYLAEMDNQEGRGAVHAPKHSAAAVKRFSVLLDFCKAHGIYLVGMLNPYPTPVLARAHKGDDFGYIWDLEEPLKAAFAQRGFPLFNFHSVAEVGSGDDEFINGFHGSEVCYARMMAFMAGRDPVLVKYVDVEKVRKLIEGRRSGLELNL